MTESCLFLRKTSGKFSSKISLIGRLNQSGVDPFFSLTFQTRVQLSPLQNQCFCGEGGCDSWKLLFYHLVMLLSKFAKILFLFLKILFQPHSLSSPLGILMIQMLDPLLLFLRLMKVYTLKTFLGGGSPFFRCSELVISSVESSN